MTIERDHKLTVMLSEEERVTLQGLADNAGIDVSGFIRTWIHRHGFEIQVEREWTKLRSVHRQVITALMAGGKINKELLNELSENQLFKLANRLLHREPNVSAAYQAYAAAFVVADTTEGNLSIKFEILSRCIESWRKRIRQRTMEA